MLPVARTRITVPPSISRLAARPRLLGRLDAASRCALVAGPGYGKSTLLSQWVASRELPCMWYALVESDDEIYRFVTHLLAAIAEQRADAALQALLREGFGAAQWRAAIDTAINALAADAGPCVLVLDDVHHVQSADVAEALAYFVRFLPGHVRLMLTSRQVPEFPQWRAWVVRGQMDVLDAETLALTQAEIPGPDAAKILDTTGGWPLAVDFLALQPHRTALVKRDALQDLILAEVWEHLSPQEQDFLLQSSLLEVLTDGGPMLERLAQQGSFIRRWPDGTYRIHDLFREFLRSRIEQDPSRARHGHRAAADALLAQGASLDAVSHLVACGDVTEALEILRQQAPELLARGRQAHLLRLLEAFAELPPDLLLQSAHALRQAGQFDTALARYQQVAEVGGTALLARTLAGQAQVYIDTVQPAQAAPLLRQAYRLGGDKTGLLESIAENALNSGRAHAAARYRRLAQRVGHGAGARQLEARIWLRTGQLQTARTVLRERLAGAEAERAAGGHREDALVLSYIASLEGQVDEAEALARQGLEQAQKGGSVPTEAVAWMRLGHALQLKDDAAAAGCYVKALELSRQVGIERLQAEALMGQSLLYGTHGDVTGSYQAALDGLAFTQKAGDQWLSAWLKLTAGIAATRGRHPQARTLLAQAQAELARVRDPFGGAVAHLWLSEGDRRGLDPAYGFLVERRTLFGAPLQEAAAPLPGRVRVQCLGAFRVFRDGQPIGPRAWKREKARELFLILVTRRNRLVQKEELMDLLWPDATAQAANRDFRVALHALSDAVDPERPRHALAGCIERQGTAYGFRISDTTSLDVEDFERLLERAAAGEDALKWRQKALDLYQGDFLEEYPYSEWAEGERERLRSRFLEAGERLAREALAQGDDETALQAAHALLAREKAWESAWQIIIQAHRHKGRDFMAQRAYEQCVEALFEELGVEPSAATKALLR